MQTIHQYITVSNYRGENVTSGGAASNAVPFLVLGMTGTFVVHLVDAEGHPAPLADISEVAGWTFVMAGDWDPFTAPCFRTPAVVYDPTAATFTVTLEGTRTAEFVALLGDEAYRSVGCELAGLPSGGTWDRPAVVVQWNVNVRGRRDSDGVSLDPNSGNATASALLSPDGEARADLSDAGAIVLSGGSLPLGLYVSVAAWTATPTGRTTRIPAPPSGLWRLVGGVYVPTADASSAWTISQSGSEWRLCYGTSYYATISNFATAPALGSWSSGIRIVECSIAFSWERRIGVPTAAQVAALADGIELAETDTLQNTRTALRTLLARLARFAALALAFLPMAARADGGTTLDTMVPTNVLYTAAQFDAALGAILQAQPDAVTFELHRLILGDHERRLRTMETNGVDGTGYMTQGRAEELVQSRLDAFAADLVDPAVAAYDEAQLTVRAALDSAIGTPYFLPRDPTEVSPWTVVDTTAAVTVPLSPTLVARVESTNGVAGTIGAFSGTLSANPSWLVLTGFASVAFPSNCVVTGSYTTGQKNFFRVYGIGADVLVERVAP